MIHDIGDKLVYCVEPSVKFYPSTVQITDLKNYEIRFGTSLTKIGTISEQDITMMALMLDYLDKNLSVDSELDYLIKQCSVWRYTMEYCTTGYSPSQYCTVDNYDNYLNLYNSAINYANSNKDKYIGKGYLMRGEYSQSVAFFELEPIIVDVPIKLQKTTNASSQYQAKHTLIGSEFTVYTDQACTQIAKDAAGNNAIITITNQDNTGNINLVPGTYWIKETKPTKGYKLNTGSKKIDITNGQPIILEFENNAAFSNLQIKKNIIGGYSVSGTTFVLYEDQACTKQAKDSDNKPINMSVNNYGLTDTVELEEGIYYIKEKSTSQYYNLKQDVLKVTLAADSTKVQDFVNELKPGKGKVKKTY